MAGVAFGQPRLCAVLPKGRFHYPFAYRRILENIHPAVQREQVTGSGLLINADLGPGEIGQVGSLDQNNTNLLESAMRHVLSRVAPSPTCPDRQKF
jgi:hypothetical protein